MHVPNCLNNGQFFPVTDEKVKNGHEIWSIWYVSHDKHNYFDFV